MAKITPTQQKEIVRRLVNEFQPEAVFLFGSYAWGSPQAESDLDLLVIVSASHERPIERSIRAQRSLRGLLTPVDVLIKTRMEFELYRPVKASLEAQIYRKGRLLYGRKTAPGKKLAQQSAP